jgi:pimeloyl-ACP methyl ester carboxylesterase
MRRIAFIEKCAGGLRLIQNVPEAAQRAGPFPVGYHQLHPDISLNYQMNRFLGNANALEEIRSAAPKIHDYADFVRESLALSERALSGGERLNGALYLRSAEFFMFSGDPRRQEARRRFVQLMREEFSISGRERHEIPYGEGKLFAYRFTGPEPKGTIVFFGGFDSYLEESFQIFLYLRDAGFDVVAFEGPGQGATLEDSLIPMTPQWEQPVKAIMDHFRLDDVTLMGLSLGGCLAIRAAAHERRVQRVIADDILTDFHETILGKIPALYRGAFSAMLSLRAGGIINSMVERSMKKSLVEEWGVKHGMHVMGSKTPYEFLRKTQLYRTDDISHLVNQDVLLMAGAEDHFVPLHQFYDQIRSLSHARSITARLFTREEQAQNHCQIGNLGLSLRVIADWIRAMQDRKEKEIPV